MVKAWVAKDFRAFKEAKNLEKKLCSECKIKNKESKLSVDELIPVDSESDV